MNMQPNKYGMQANKFDMQIVVRTPREVKKRGKKNFQVVKTIFYFLLITLIIAAVAFQQIQIYKLKNHVEKLINEEIHKNSQEKADGTEISLRKGRHAKQVGNKDDSNHFHKREMISLVLQNDETLRAVTYGVFQGWRIEKQTGGIAYSQGTVTIKVEGYYQIDSHVRVSALTHKSAIYMYRIDVNNVLMAYTQWTCYKMVCSQGLSRLRYLYPGDNVSLSTDAFNTKYAGNGATFFSLHLVN